MIAKSVLEHFKLKQNPFEGDIRGDRDILLTQQNRYLPDYMQQTMKLGGMVALVGEVGAGKSTLRRLAMSRLEADGVKVKVIMPRTFDKSRLTASGICTAILDDLKCPEARCRTLEGQARQVERLLIESQKAGNHHVLLIEEAHDLSRQTLKYLKRFWEMEHGYDKLLSILLVGQNELHTRLDLSSNWDAREVIQRLEVLEVQALQNAEELREYLELKLSRVGATACQVFDAGAYAALFGRLVCQQGQRIVSEAYPLRVNRLVADTLRLAVRNEEDRVYADTVRSL
ncbi:AAA family ATPase [Candidatus Haliotispira prima]|uniref:AAA family ATPase n=1 Tax=Candidatus Haliotispira prima TaxID=3034016 RepID=A0ABY8MEU1_9SPIO|nr:AAA family ATPase [Candidatus Haliotispira prima]